MFSNRGFGWKLAGAIGLVLALGAHSANSGPRQKPGPSTVLAQPAKYDGREVWIPNGLVVSAGPEEFLLEAEALALRVVGRADVRPGESVGVVGTFEAAGPRLRLREVKRPRGSGGHRSFMVLVSLVVLGVVVANFARHFAFRPRAAEVGGTG